MFKMKEQDLSQKLNEMEINNLSDKEFKVMIIKMLTKLRRRMDDHSENFSRVRKYFKKSELKNTITEIKNTLEGINGRLDDTEE